MSYTQHIINPLDEATTHDLVTLDEMRTSLRIPTGDLSKDEAITFMISNVSSQMARMVNRDPGFGKMRISETFYNITPQERLYVSRWPVKLDDIEVMNLNGVDMLSATNWRLEEHTGILYIPPTGNWNGTLEMIYSGGYELPDEAPRDLRGAATQGVREEYINYIRGALMTGVQSISHKSARVQFMRPLTTMGAHGTMGLSPTWQGIWNTLSHYYRHWV
jgi:hypothetical protein